MAYTNYKPIDGKLGISSPSGAVPPRVKGNWAQGTAYVVGDVILNGPWAFGCSVAGTSAASGAGPMPSTLTDNTVTWVYLGSNSPLYSQDAAAAIELGYIAVGSDPTYGEGEFIYVKFTGTVHAGDFVVVDRQGLTAVQTPAAAPGAGKLSVIGLSTGEQVSGTYGWVMLRGVADFANVTAALTVGTILTGSGVAGRCNQAVANYIFEGAVLRVAGVAGAGTVELYWPVCSGR